MSQSYTPVAAEMSNHSTKPSGFFSFKKRAELFGALTFIILASLVAMLAYQRVLITKEFVRTQTYDVVIAAKDKLQESLTQGIAAIKTLSFFIQPDGTIHDFEQVAAQIVSANSGVDVLQLVPDGIISYVYPMQGNEQVIGYNILKDPLRNKEAFKAIQKKEVFFAGPLDLKQGGIGVVGRLPVFRNNEFWGFSAVVIKMSTLLKAAGIDSLRNNGYFFQLSKINPDSHLEEHFINHPKGFTSKNFVTVNMLNQEWKLSAEPVNKSAHYRDIFWVGLLGFLFAVLGGVFVFILMKRPEKLDELVRIRTAALQESEEKYRSLIEQASDGVIVYSFDGTIYHFNKAAHMASGYTRDEFSKLNLKDLLLERKVVNEHLRANEMNPAKTASFERRLCRKDGAVQDIEINANLLPDGNLLAFVRDMSQRKAAEKALKESEAKFSKAFQSGFLAFAIHDEDNLLVDANETYASLLEINREDIIGKRSAETMLTNRIPAENREAARATIETLLQTRGRLQHYEMQIETTDGRPVFLLLSVEPIVLNDQPHRLSTAIDITEKKEAELLLRKNEAKYRSLIEQASDGIIITDLKGIISEVNKSISVMGGYSEEEMIGKHADNFLPKQDRVEQPLRFEELLKGETLLYERRMQKKDGTTIDVEVNSKMAIGDTLIGIVRDITERKKAGEELKRSNERFELIALATNDAIWDHNFITDVTTGNDNLYNLYGFDKAKDKIHFDTFIKRIHPYDKDRMLINLEEAISKKEVFITEEFRFQLADGSYVNMYDRAYMKYDDTGKPTRIMGVMQDITGRVKGEEAIIREKELSDSIINSLQAVFYIYNRQGKFLRWNKRLETVTGYSAEEVKNLHPLELFDEAEKPLLEEKIKNVFLAGHDTVEANFISKEKQKIPYYFSGIRIEYEGEVCLMGFGLDFSDKVKVEKAIKESEKKFRSLVEQASDGVAILKPSGDLVYISPAGQRIAGYTDTDMIGLNVFDLTYAQDRDEITKRMKEAIDNPGHPIKSCAYRMLHKNGSWRWIENTITCMLNIPSIDGIVANFRDVTEKILIEKKIIAEKELSDSIINSLPGIFYLYDHTGKFIRWNKNLETVSGFTAAEIKTMHPLDFYDDDQKPIVAARINTIFQRKVPGIESLLLTKDKKKIPFLFNSLAIEFEGVPAVLGMGFDVTDRREIEQELLISHQHLEQKAAELITSYTELERFAYIVSHDLQEPLRMVSSFLKLLEKKYKGQLDDTGEKYIHFAVDGAERMKQLIMDLLEYSRTGTNKDITSNTDMNQVTADVLKILKNPIDEERAIVTAGRLPVLQNTSKLQMFQLMQNLIGNAIKYHAENKPVIHIEAIEEQNHWVFSVRDNGIGIDARFYEKIFIIFQRLHNKHEFSGTGIGLSICKKIVEKHGGKIWVESVPGEGSTFYFTISKSCNTNLNNNFLQ